MAADALKLRIAVALVVAGSAFACRTNKLGHLDFTARSDLMWQRVDRGQTAARPVPSQPSQPAPQRTPRARKPGPVPVVAVFDIENKGATLDGETMARLSDYLSARLAATGRYQVIPRDQLKQRLTDQKRDSYKQCYAQSCQIDIGKELAAQKSLSTQVVRLGTRCMVTAVFYDLSRSTSEGGASSEGTCEEDDLVRLIQAVIVQLAQQSQ